MRSFQPHPHHKGEVMYGKDHRVLCAQQLQEESKEVDPSRTMRESDPVRIATTEVSLTIPGTTATVVSVIGMFQQSRARRPETALTTISATAPQRKLVVPVRRQKLQASLGRLKQWLITWEHRLDCWPAFKGLLAAHEWTLWPLFLIMVVIFFLLLPRACRYP